LYLPGEILLEKRYDGMSAADAHLARISDHVSAYLQIVRSQLLATVPKAVVHCTVVPAKDNLLAELQEEVAGACLVAAAVLLRLLAGHYTVNSSHVADHLHQATGLVDSKADACWVCCAVCLLPFLNCSQTLC
jgi:hypothetical protein